MATVRVRFHIVQNQRIPAAAMRIPFYSETVCRYGNFGVVDVGVVDSYTEDSVATREKRQRDRVRGELSYLSFGTDFDGHI